MKNKNFKKIALLPAGIGTIENPWSQIGAPYSGTRGEDLITLLGNILKLIIVLSGFFVLVNIIIAGYEFMSAGGSSEKMTAAWDRIWHSLLGLAVVASSFIIAAVIGFIIFGDPTAIISPTIYSPN